MKKRESYGPQRSPFKIFLYIVVVVLLLGGIAYLVKDTRERRAVFQEQIQELGARETEFVQTKQSSLQRLRQKQKRTSLLKRHPL